ncbi:MAG: alpha/beta hydrolase, partial [Actinobacteria bacterium]|nr:alpha/beta hydrolase [Actinomycetota bacterium]
ERYTAAVMAEDVVRLLDHLRLPRAHLVGHSMGAVLAANVAARHPSRVATAALVAGPVDRESLENDLSRALRAAVPLLPPDVPRPLLDELSTAATRVGATRNTSKKSPAIIPVPA